MDLNKLSKEIHLNAINHGWWETNRDFAEIIALCHSELSEALEEYRDNNPNMYYMYDFYGTADKDTFVLCTDFDSEQYIYEKPEGIIIELIDCLIRILDYFGKNNIEVKTLIDDESIQAISGLTFTQLITFFHLYLSKAFEFHLEITQETTIEHLNAVISGIIIYCSLQNIDVEKAILIKHKYNITRPYKHGGKLI